MEENIKLEETIKIVLADLRDFINSTTESLLELVELFKEAVWIDDLSYGDTLAEEGVNFDYSWKFRGLTKLEHLATFINDRRHSCYEGLLMEAVLNYDFLITDYMIQMPFDWVKHPVGDEYETYHAIMDYIKYDLKPYEKRCRFEKALGARNSEFLEYYIRVYLVNHFIDYYAFDINLKRMLDGIDPNLPIKLD